MKTAAPSRPRFQPPPQYAPLYLSPRQAGEWTGLSAWTWRAYAYSGRIASVKTGKGKQARLLIPVSEIERIMQEGLRPALAPTPDEA
jgi:hypothetical protein